MNALLRTARPRQWIKNVLVFAAPGAAGVLDDWPAVGYAMLAFVSFCLAASGVYMWNDALDVDADRLHPTKRFRPVATGVVSVRAAEVCGTLAIVLALAVAAGTGRWQTVVVVAVYVALIITYSVWLKHVPVLDIVAVASGFVLRAAGGAVAVDVPMSSWFVLCTVFGSLFIVTGKRYAELRELGERRGHGAHDVGRVHARVPAHRADGVGRRGARQLLPVGVRDVGDGQRRLPLLRALDRPDVDGAAALRPGARAGPRRGTRGGVRQRSCAPAARAGMGRGLRARRVLAMSGPDEAIAAAAGVEGWMTDEQGERLFAVAARCPAGGRIVEIGSFRGRSTIVLALGAPDGVEVVAIDPHAGTDRGPQELSGYVTEGTADRLAFEANLARAGVVDRVRHVAAFSATAQDQVAGPIDVLYVDGAHRYAPARADLRDWGRRVTDGGTLLIHDAFSSIGVTLAIGRELVAGRRFRYVGRTRSLAEYRADLAGHGRVANAARQVAQLPWFVRNLALKVFLTVGGRRILERLGRTAPEWPY